jgi:hypothetical protein
MRTVIVVLSLCFGGCASAPADGPRRSIEVFHSESMNYMIEDGGRARFVSGSGAHPVYEFEANRDDFRRVADLLEPLKAAGLPCSRPSENIAPGHIIWRENGEEVRRVESHIICHGSEPRPLARNSEQASRLMEEMGHARYVAPVIPDPTIITLDNRYWGRPTSSWTIPRGGEGRYVDPQRTVEFTVSVETFDRIREIFHPYEERDFHCNRVLTDGPYGFVIWSSQEGQEDQRTLWDAGCVTGDASDLFARIDQAVEILVPLREASRTE